MLESAVLNDGIVLSQQGYRLGIRVGCFGWCYMDTGLRMFDRLNLQ